MVTAKKARPAHTSIYATNEIKPAPCKRKPRPLALKRTASGVSVLLLYGLPKSVLKLLQISQEPAPSNRSSFRFNVRFFQCIFYLMYPFN